VKRWAACGRPVCCSAPLLGLPRAGAAGRHVIRVRRAVACARQAMGLGPGRKAVDRAQAGVCRLGRPPGTPGPRAPAQRHSVRMKGLCRLVPVDLPVDVVVVLEQ